jgi:hypothetical protein
MKKLFMITTFLMLFAAVKAQNYEKISGFLGSRLSIGGGLSFSPSQQPQTPLEADKRSERIFGWNKMWHGDIQYVIGTYNAVGLTFGNQRTSAIVEDNSLNAVYWGEQYNYDSYEHRLVAISGSPDIKDLFYGAYFKRYLFSKGSMAPVGTYIKIGAVIHNYQINFSRIRIISNSNLGFGNYEILENKFEFDEGEISKLEVLAGIGKTRPIGGRILLDLSMEAGYIGNSGPKEVAFGLVNEKEGNPVAIMIVEQIQSRLSQVNYLKFTIGCTILLF